jgi:hypothetical protein
MRQQAQQAPVPVDRAALEMAHRVLCSPTPLDEMLKVSALEIILDQRRARSHAAPPADVF